MWAHNHEYVLFVWLRSDRREFQDSFKRERKMKEMNLLTSIISKGISKLALCDCSRPPSLNHNVVRRDGGLKRPFEIIEKEIFWYMTMKLVKLFLSKVRILKMDKIQIILNYFG